MQINIHEDTRLSRGIANFGLIYDIRTRAFTRAVPDYAGFKASAQRSCAAMPESPARSSLAVSAAAINRRMDYSRAAVLQAGTADQVVPHAIACFGPENPVKRDFLRICTGTAEPLEMTAARSRHGVGVPGPCDGLPQRALERLVVIVKSVLPLQEGRFHGRYSVAA
jgi:hypothetical protein